MNTKRAEVQLYVAVSLAVEVKGTLDSHVISFNLEEGDRDMANASLRSVMREL